jgi:hypothetical protein
MPGQLSKSKRVNHDMAPGISTGNAVMWLEIVFWSRQKTSIYGHLTVMKRHTRGMVGLNAR